MIILNFEHWTDSDEFAVHRPNGKSTKNTLSAPSLTSKRGDSETVSVDTSCAPSGSVSMDARDARGGVLTKLRFKFIVPKFSMYIEQPQENRTLCKVRGGLFGFLKGNLSGNVHSDCF